MRIDPNGPTWLAIQAYLAKRLATLREKNDRHLPEPETAKLRGQIEEVKALLRLPAVQDDPVVEGTPIEHQFDPQAR
jgi:hypothetical protein